MMSVDHLSDRALIPDQPAITSKDFMVNHICSGLRYTWKSRDVVEGASCWEDICQSVEPDKTTENIGRKWEGHMVQSPT